MAGLEWPDCERHAWVCGQNWRLVRKLPRSKLQTHFSGTHLEGIVDRRDFIRFGGVAAIEVGAAKLLGAQTHPELKSNSAAPETTKADFTLRIGPVIVE